MKFVSSVSKPDTPRHIAVVSDQEAVVTTDNKKLVMLNIPGGIIAAVIIKQLSIKHTVQLEHGIKGISSIQDKLVVTCPGTKPTSVKLIDRTGKVY